MICIFLSIIFTIFICFCIGLIIFAFVLIEPVANIIYIGIPLAKLATIETFLELGLLIHFVLNKIFEYSRKVKIIGIIIILVLVISSIYHSFSSPLTLMFHKIPILSDLYYFVYDFFSNIVNHIKEFFLG